MICYNPSDGVRHMNISLSPKTQKLLEQQMKQGRFSSHDEALQAALQTLDEIQGEPIEGLDDETQAALERAFAQSERGEGQPFREFRKEFEAKHFRGK